MEDCSKGPLPHAVAILLADIASHHRCLKQASDDINRTLKDAQHTTHLAQKLLLQGAERSFGSVTSASKAQAMPQVGGAVFAGVPPEGFQKLTPAAGDTSEELNEELAPSSEWRRQVVAKSSGHSNSEVVHASRRDSGEGDTGETQAAEEEDTFSAGEEHFPPQRRSLMSSEYSEEEWDFRNDIVRRNAIARLQERLGKTTMKGNVAAFQVHGALQAMEVSAYTIDDIEHWFEELERINTEWGLATSWQRTSSFFRAGTATRISLPEELTNSYISEDFAHKYPGAKRNIRFKVFVDTILDDDLIKRFDPDVQKMTQTIREVLCSGGCNLLVSKLTRINMEEVAAPMDRPDCLTLMEPYVAFVIALNGVFIGVQTSAATREGLDAWFWGNFVFAIVMVLEVFFRCYMAGGLVGFMRTSDKWWNMFDCCMVLVAVCDIALEALQSESQMTSISIMRIMRLTRLTRLIRIFRLHILKELNLMIRGLLGGLRTLFWAIVLLFFTLYVIGVWMTTTIGPGIESVPEVVEEELFSSVPRSIVTCFRCFMGDCETRNGRPIIKLLADAYGFTFILGYMAASVFIVFGLFNLIIAVYVESTMSAAKTEGKKTLAERGRDNIILAKQARQLLKKFCVADRLWSSRSSATLDKKDFVRAMQNSALDDVEERSMQVSKDLYLAVIQDPGVKKIMDDMDIPPERPHLFDILDADSSGDLEVSELITGLLRVRGEARKCDVVGTLLAVRALQDMVREQREQMVSIELQIAQVKARAPSVRKSSELRPSDLRMSRGRSSRSALDEFSRSSTRVEVGF